MLNTFFQAKVYVILTLVNLCNYNRSCLGIALPDTAVFTIKLWRTPWHTPQTCSFSGGGGSSSR